MTNPKKNGDLMLRVRYDSGAELAGPAVITDEGALLVSLGGAASMLVQRADGSLPPHITFVDIRPSHLFFGLRRPCPLGRGGSKPSSFHRLI